MRYLELISERPLAWALFGGYMVVTALLAWRGHAKTGDMKSYAVGRGDMGPVVVGVTLAASIASTATFVINPGFVYVHGLSALLHLGAAVGLGVIIGLVVMSTGFQRIGAATGAVTLPQWIGDRYRSRRLAVLFAAINLLSLSFVVLILGGLSIVMQQTLGLSNTESLVIMVVFVFGYVFVGGAYAHAYTNTLQGIIMAVIAVIITGSGLHFFADGLAPVGAALRAVDPDLVAPVNPASNLYNSFFSVYVSGLVIGFALVCQPHIMTKALYVRDSRAIRRYLPVAIVVSLVFSSLLLVGLYAHLAELPRAALVDPATGSVRQDAVMTAYVTSVFSPAMVAVITVALMSAGMSTLDGILVALSSIAANDLYLNLGERRWLTGASESERSRAAHRASQIILVAMGAVAFVIALDPPRLLGIFGQVGVYGIVAAAAVPILFGILWPAMDSRLALIATLTGLVGHFALYAWGQVVPRIGIEYGLANPGVSATYGIVASAVVALIGLRWARARQVTDEIAPGASPAMAPAPAARPGRAAWAQEPALRRFFEEPDFELRERGLRGGVSSPSAGGSR